MARAPAWFNGALNITQICLDSHTSQHTLRCGGGIKKYSDEWINIFNTRMIRGGMKKYSDEWINIFNTRMIRGRNKGV